jgi:DNA-binding transcriptional LysR family regulator
MNLGQLSMFLEVAKWGSLSEAARQQSLTQPAVTRKMQRLERELAADLFERGEGHQIVLTSQGRDFLQYAQQTLAAYAALQERWYSLRHDVKGVLNLIASSTSGEFLVPHLLANFVSLYPNVNPTLAILDSEEVIDRVIARDYDAGFVGLPANRPNLEQVAISEDEIVLAVNLNHRFAQAQRHEVSLNELTGETLVVREPSSGTSQLLKRLLAANNLTLPPHKVIMTLGSTQALVSSIRAGLGSGFVSTRAVEANDHLWIVRFPELTFKRELYLIYEQGRELNASLLLRTFIAFVTNSPAPVVDSSADFRFTLEDTDED